MTFRDEIETEVIKLIEREVGVMTTRDELIEVGAKACATVWEQDEPDGRDRRIAVAVVDAVEPLIRADEERRVMEFCCEDTEPDIRRAVLAELRGKVEKKFNHLGPFHPYAEFIPQILALIDEASA